MTAAAVDAYDLVVVGAGLAGACTAWAAGRRGLRTAVLERFEPGHQHGSSHGTSRIFRRAYGDPFYVELTARAAESWDRLEDDAGVVLRSFTGGVDHGRDRDPKALARVLARASVPHVLLSAEEAARRWPHLVFTTDVLYHPDAGVLDADLAVATALERARARGVEVYERTAVTAVVPEADGAVVHAAGAHGGPRSLAARHVVLAAGAWNQRWLPTLLGTSAPALTVTQQQVAHFRQHEPAARARAWPVGAPLVGAPLVGAWPVGAWPVVVHKDGGSQMFATPAGRAAPGAVKVGEHGRGTVTTGDERDGVVDPGAVERLARYVAEFFPTLVPEPFAAASCLYATTPSEDFVVDAVGPLVACSPCSGHGAKFAAHIGELVTAVAVGDAQPPDRFRLAAHRPPQVA